MNDQEFGEIGSNTMERVLNEFINHENEILRNFVRDNESLIKV